MFGFVALFRMYRSKEELEDRQAMIRGVAAFGLAAGNDPKAALFRFAE